MGRGVSAITLKSDFNVGIRSFFPLREPHFLEVGHREGGKEETDSGNDGIKPWVGNCDSREIDAYGEIGKKCQKPAPSQTGLSHFVGLHIPVPFLNFLYSLL